MRFAVGIQDDAITSILSSTKRKYSRKRALSGRSTYLQLDFDVLENYSPELLFLDTSFVFLVMGHWIPLS